MQEGEHTHIYIARIVWVVKHDLGRVKFLNLGVLADVVSARGTAAVLLICLCIALGRKPE